MARKCQQGWQQEWAVGGSPEVQGVTSQLWETRMLCTWEGRESDKGTQVADIE